MNEPFQMLKELIENTYIINGNISVATVSLSMGGPYFMLFLNRYVDQAWKDQYIHSFTSFSGVFGGSTSSLLTTVTPTFFGISVDTAIQVMDLARSWGKKKMKKNEIISK